MARFKRVVAHAEDLRSPDTEVYYLGMGDYVDRMSPSNRDAYQRAGFYDSVEDALDLVAEKDLEDLFEVLEPTKGRWLGLLEGHHFHPFNDGTTSDMRLANFLDAPFLGTSAYVGMHFIATQVPERDVPRSPKIKGKKKTQRTHSHSAKLTIWCVDTETEALTRQGWRKYNEIPIGAEILAYDHEKGEVAWQRMTDQFVGPYSGPMHSFASNGKEIAFTTPDHRWLVSNGASRRWQERTSENIVHPRWVTPALGRVPAGDESLDDDFVRQVAWVVTEGMFRTRNDRPEMAVYQSEGPHVAELDRLFGDHREARPGEFVWHLEKNLTEQIVRWLREDKTPTMEFYWRLSPRQRLLLYDEMDKGDGDGVRLYQSRRTSLLDDMQGVLASAGTASSLNWLDNAGTIEIKGVIANRNYETGRLKPYTMPVRRIVPSGVQEWSGTVWCPTVASSYWVARRNGVVYVTGNCHHGRGGGQLLGSALNQLEKKAIGFDADIYLFGHHHKILTGWSPQISPVWGTKGLRDIRHRDRLMATTGSFLRGYMVGNQRGGRPRGSYVEQGAMNPVTLGALAIKLRPTYTEGPAYVQVSVESGQYH